jgi:hypothetical protein
LVEGGKEAMTMTEKEIVKSYNEAKHKKAQIGILADLNCCDSSTIKDILRENGIDLRGANGGRVQKQDPVKVKGCLKDQNGSCAGCDETDLCTAYVKPEPVKEGKPNIPDEVMIEIIRFGIEAIEEKISSKEEEVEKLTSELEGLKKKRTLFREYGLIGALKDETRQL